MAISYVRLLVEHLRKNKKEVEVPEGMVLVPRQTLEDYLAEYDNPVPDPVLKSYYRRRLADCLKD